VRLVIRQYFKLLTSRHDRIKSQFHPAFGRWRSETENGLAESHIDICKVSHLLVMGSLSCEKHLFLFSFHFVGCGYHPSPSGEILRTWSRVVPSGLIYDLHQDSNFLKGGPHCYCNKLQTLNLHDAIFCCPSILPIDFSISLRRTRSHTCGQCR
jgi:hypothetical protein